MGGQIEQGGGTDRVGWGQKQSCDEVGGTDKAGWGQKQSCDGVGG